MSMRNVVVSNYGIEKDFIFAFIKSVLNESVSPHTITCKIGTNSIESDAVSVAIASSDTENTAINNVFADTSSSIRPNFWFTIDDNIKMRFTRSASAGEATVSYSITTIINGISYGGDTYYSDSLYFSDSRDPASISAERAWKYQLLSNSNVLYIIFGSYDNQMPFYPNYRSSSGYTITYTYQAFSYKKVSGNNTEWMGGLYCGAYLFDSNGIKSSFINRLNYINDPIDSTAIETIQSKVAKNSAGGYKAITMDNLWDSSYNQAVMLPVSIGNNQYVYLNNYTLMPI